MKSYDYEIAVKASVRITVNAEHHVFAESKARRTAIEIAKTLQAAYPDANVCPGEIIPLIPYDKIELEVKSIGGVK